MTQPPRRPRLGMLVYATDTGLGNQTHNLYRHLHPERTMLVDISRFNKLPVHEHWYEYQVRTNGYPSKEDIDAFLVDVDVVLMCESPLNYYLIERANQLGIKTIIQYNYEFLDYHKGPHLPKPTVFAAPTTWNMERVRQMVGDNVELLPVPIEDKADHKPTTNKIDTYFHIAGRPAVYDRNGTNDFIQAIRLMWHLVGAKYIIYCQSPTREMRHAASHLPLTIIDHVNDYEDLYNDGQMLVMPRRYGGLCLPAQEAVGYGIPVLMPNVGPNNDWLPKEWLLPVTNKTQTFMAHTPVDMHQVDIVALAQKMADLVRHPEAVEAMYEQAKDLRARMSWDSLLPRYNELMERLCT